jgi:SAM-dependent methyltransferase
MADLVRGKTVLDVGCVDHSARLESSDRWMHKHLVRAAASVIGLDILESEAAKLRERGYNVVAGDASTVDLGQTFDLVVAGEIIEHIDNPGAFLRNMARHLNSAGRLVLTTPNPFFVMHQFEFAFVSSLDKRWNHEHVCWYCPFTLGNLLERSGLTVDSCYFFTRSRKLLKVLGVLGLPCFGPLASSFVVVARRSD